MSKEKEKKIVERKYYNKLDNLFHIEIVEINNNREKVLYKKIYNNYEDFAKAIKYNFYGVNLYDYNFKKSEINKYDLKNAILSLKQQEKIGIINDCLCKNLVGELEIENYKFRNYELCNSNPELYEDENDKRIIYISDLHLNCKKEFSKNFNEYDFI